MKDDNYDHITWLIKQAGQLVVDLELNELHIHQKIERLNAVIQELQRIREQYEKEQSELIWQEPIEVLELADIDSDAA